MNQTQQAIPRTARKVLEVTKHSLETLAWRKRSSQHEGGFTLGEMVLLASEACYQVKDTPQSREAMKTLAQVALDKVGGKRALLEASKAIIIFNYQGVVVEWEDHFAQSVEDVKEMVDFAIIRLSPVTT